MVNVNKIWFYSTAMAVVIAGVWFSLPGEEQQQKMRAAAAKKKNRTHSKSQTKTTRIRSRPARTAAAAIGCLKHAKRPPYSQTRRAFYVGRQNFQAAFSLRSGQTNQAA